MNRILGLDYGRQRIGVAICDALGITAQPLDTFKRLTWSQIVNQLNEIKKQYRVELIILGHPLKLNGERGRMAREAERFGAHLENHLNVDVKLWDERLSSVQSMKVLHSLNQKIGRDKGLIDRMAATLILQAYLDKLDMTRLDNHSEEVS